jgi:hypothetical protein
MDSVHHLNGPCGVFNVHPKCGDEQGPPASTSIDSLGVVSASKFVLGNTDDCDPLVQGLKQLLAETGSSNTKLDVTINDNRVDTTLELNDRIKNAWKFTEKKTPWDVIGYNLLPPNDGLPMRKLILPLSKQENGR